MHEKSYNLIDNTDQEDHTRYELLVDDKNNEKKKIINNEYYVSSYDIKCEEHLKIKKLIPLVKNNAKYCIYIVLNIITFFFINILIQWYPTILLYIYYSKSTLEKATHVGIYCTKESDYVFEVVKLNQIHLPKVFSDKNNIITNFHINLPSYSYILMFEYKLFSYIFNPNTNNFESLDYHIYETQSNFLQKFSVGLRENEVQFMRLIFGNCILNVELNSIFDFLWEELERPERVFEIFSFAIWFYSAYNLSYIIFVFTIISTVINVYEEKRLFQLLLFPQ